mgnify:CR=1 FL=1
MVAVQTLAGVTLCHPEWRSQHWLGGESAMPLGWFGSQLIMARECYESAIMTRESEALRQRCIVSGLRVLGARFEMAFVVTFDGR